MFLMDIMDLRCAGSWAAVGFARHRHNHIRLLRRERVPSDWAVDVTSFPLPARGWVASLLRTQRKLSAEAAEQALENLPVCLGDNLTRGQAEDLLALCRRERVAGAVRQNGG